MSGQAERAQHFLALHEAERPLLIPNPWDRGSAKLLASLGFEALATTSAGAAAEIGRLDGTLTAEEALANAAEIVEAVEVPVSADLENGFADDPEGVAETLQRAVEIGLAGASIEDYSGREEEPIYDLGRARERIAAAAEVARGGPRRLVLTARAENHFRGVGDLADTIARLQAYQEAGADVLYAPWVTSLEDIRAIVDSVNLPVNVLTRPEAPNVAELAAIGVKRISVGGAFAFAALGAAVEAARELREAGTYGYMERAGVGLQAARSAFADEPGA